MKHLPQFPLDGHQSAAAFTHFLSGTLIPDLRADGLSATADDLETAALIIDRMAPFAEACRGLTLPEAAPPGILADLVAAARGLLSGPSEGHVAMGEPDSFENRSRRLESILAALTPGGGVPVSPPADAVALTSEERQVICAKLLNSDDRRDVVKSILQKLDP